MPGKPGRDVNELVRSLSLLPWVKSTHPLLYELQDRCTPLEFADVLTRLDRFSSGMQRVVGDLHITKLLKQAPPEPYRQYNLREGVSFYSDPSVSPDRKCLLFIFGAAAGRPMTSRVSFVQCLPASRYDICFFWDTQKVSFERGIAGYAEDLPELAKKATLELKAHRYRRLATFGVSLGGLAALRFGIMVGAERAVCVGGRFNWHVGRLVKNRTTVPAFDLLCDCCPSGKTRLIYFHGEFNVLDAQHLARLRRTREVEARIVPGCDHNAVHPFLENGTLRELLAELLEGEAGENASAPAPLARAPLPPHMLL